MVLSQPKAARRSRAADETAADDVALARALMAGDPEAPLVAWQRFQRMVTGTLRRMLGGHGDLQDLTQEVFLRFFTKVGTLKKAESLRSFVMGIAVRRAQEEIKRRRVRGWKTPALETVLAVTAAATEMDPEARQALSHLYRALDQLTVIDRTVYVLRYVEGRDQAHISETLGVSISTVRRRLDRLCRNVSDMVSADPVLAEYVAAGGR